MNLDDFPAPKEGFAITHVLVVADQDRSREYYRSLLGGQVLLERDPVIIKAGNTWLTLWSPAAVPPTTSRASASARRPTPDRPAGSSTCAWPTSHGSTRSGRTRAPFLTEPKDHGREIRAYVRDPDGHLIEVGQATGLLD